MTRERWTRLAALLTVLSLLALAILRLPAVADAEQPAGAAAAPVPLGADIPVPSPTPSPAPLPNPPATRSAPPPPVPFSSRAASEGVETSGEPVRLVVKLEPPSVLLTLRTLGRSAAQAVEPVSVEDVIPQARVQRFVVPAERAPQALETLRRRPDVAYAEPERPVRIHQSGAGTPIAPNDPLYNQQWALPKITAPAAWAVSRGSSPVTVAIVDTGIQLSHPDFAARIAGGVDCTVSPCQTGSGKGNDGHGHGTHVAGIVAAATDNGEGVAGVAWGSAVRLLAVKALRDNGTGTDAMVAAGIRWAVDSGARVINMSLGGPYDPNTSDRVITDEIDYAYSQGVLVVVSAGNCGGSSAVGDEFCNFQQNWPDSPAIYAATQPAKLIPVGATAQDDSRSSFSTQHDYVRLAGVAAPGSSILSTGDRALPGFSEVSCQASSYYCTLSGTSMAAPHVAGLAALLWSTFPALSVDAVHSAILQSAVDLGAAGADSAFGAGRIDAAAAMLRASGAAGTPTATSTPVQTTTPPATSTATATPSVTATATPSRTPTTTATATATASVTATSTATATRTATATVAPAAPAAPATGGSDAPSSGDPGGSSGGGSGSGGGSAPSAASGSTSTGGGSSSSSGARSPGSSSRTSQAVTPAAPSDPQYLVATDAGAVEVRGSNGSIVRADVATIDPATGRRRFRGWLRSDSGPIFGVSPAGRLEWISPDDHHDLVEIDWAKVQTIPDDALSAVPPAPPREGWLLWDFRGSGRIFVVGADGMLHHIPDMATFLARFEWRNVLPVSAGQMAQLPAGTTLPSVQNP